MFGRGFLENARRWDFPKIVEGRFTFVFELQIGVLIGLSQIMLLSHKISILICHKKSFLTYTVFLRRFPQQAFVVYFIFCIKKCPTALLSIQRTRRCVSPVEFDDCESSEPVKYYVLKESVLNPIASLIIIFISM